MPGLPTALVDTTEQSVVSVVSQFTGDSSFARSSLDDGSAASVNSYDHHSARLFRLSLGNIPLVGRDAETKILHNALKQAKTTGASSLVVCRGPSGVGKSKMMIDALRDPVFAQGGFFVSGKFDQLLTQQAPFSAIVSTFSDLCDLLLQHEEKSKIVESMRERFGASDTLLLARLIPSLGFLVEAVEESRGQQHRSYATLWTQKEQEESAGLSEHSQQAYTKFKILCRTFLQVVATSDHPVVILWDDLQWADEASLDLIQGLAKDSLKNTLLLASCRTEEEYATTSPNLDDFFQFCRSESFPLVFKEITLGPLTVENINDIVSSLTMKSTPETLALSQVLLRKTLGNAYFCMRFLEMLHRVGLIHPCGGASRGWEWNVERIESETNATDNVADLVTGQLENVERWPRLVMIYAAHLGHRFRVDLLQQVLYAEAASEDDRGSTLNNLWSRVAVQPQEQRGEDAAALSAKLYNIKDALVVATTQGLVEECGSSGKSLKFTHDRVQDCLLAMLTDPRDAESLHKRFGWTLQSVLNAEEDQTTRMEDAEMTRFLSVDFLNDSKNLHTLDSEKLNLAKLNLEVAELGASKGAYCHSRDYLRHALEYLPQQVWKKSDDYDLYLRVHELSAEMEYCTGFPDRAKIMIDIVLKHANTKGDTLAVYQTYVASLSVSGRLEEALDVGFEALRQCNVKFPKPKRVTMAHIVVELVKTRRALKNYTFDEILEVPLMSDPEKLAAFNIMSHVALCAFHLAEKGKNSFVMIGLRATRLSLKYGLNGLSTHALSAYGAIITILGGIDDGCRFADLSMKMSKKLDARDMEGRMLVTSLGFLEHWHTPLQDLQPEMMRGHKLAMEYADVTYAFINLGFYFDTSFFLGLMPLSGLAMKLHYAIELAREFGMTHQLPNLLSLHQTVLNLAGETEGNPSILSGDIAHAEDLIRENERTKKVNSTAFVLFYQLVLAYHFESLVLLEELIPLVDKNHKHEEGVFTQRFMMFYVGISSLLLYNRTGQKKHRRHGKKVLTKFRSWRKAGYANTSPMVEILEMMHCSTKKSVTTEMRQTAIRAAETEQLGFHWAVANEQAADSCTAQDGVAEQRRYITDAITLYEQLEMFGKVHFLERKYRSILDH